jgi:hypothetical protein
VNANQVSLFVPDLDEDAEQVDPKDEQQKWCGQKKYHSAEHDRLKQIDGMAHMLIRPMLH